MKSRFLSVILTTMAILMPAKLLAQEPYAVLSNENTVLTFYYDDQKTARAGMDVGPFDTSDSQSWYDERGSITSVVFDASFADCTSLTSTAYWFDGCKNLTSITGMGNLNTDNVTNMCGMFESCSGLTSLDVSGFNTSNVTDMRSMFYGCSSLMSLDLSNFNTEKVNKMSSMFQGCSGLTSLDLSSFNTENVTEMQGMFLFCSGLTSLNVSSFNTVKITSMMSMFWGCSGLASLDVSNFNTSSVTNMYGVFSNCSSLTHLDLSGFNTANVTDMSAMFMECSGLKTIYVGNDWSTASVTSGSNMFTNCTALVGGAGTHYDANYTDYTYAHIDEGTSNPGYFTAAGAEPWVDQEPYAVLSDENTVLTFYYDDQKMARGGMDVGPFDTSDSQSWYDERESITSVVFDASFAGCTTLTSTAWWFNQLNNLTTITGINYLKTDNVTSMRSMFHRCSSLTSLDLSSFNTENVTVMQDMFSSCTALTSLDLSSFNTENVTDMQEMFLSCSALTALDLSSFNTANVTKMGAMFEQCEALTSLNVSSFNTINVTDMYEMFRDTALPSLDLSNFNTTNVTDMGQMFDGCSALTSLDLSGFNTANVSDIHRMFYDCSALKTIYVGNDWSTASVTSGSNMFTNCTALVGGAGTHYDANYTDYTYAHIDEGTSNPGYFTAAGAEPWVDPEATFDDYGVLTVGGATTMAEALEFVGGKEMVAETITAIVWNSTAVITNSDMQGIDNPNLLVYVNDASLAPTGVQNVVIDGTAKEIILKDADGNNNWYCPQPFTAQKISYTRNFQQKTQIGVARGWESIALPFDVQTITYEDNRTITPFDNYDSVYHFWLRRLTQNGLQSVQEINANVAYVISMPNSSEYPGEYILAGNVTFSAENAPIPETEPEMDESVDRAMAPAFQRMEADEYIYALNVGEPRGSYPEGSVFEKNYREVRPFEAFTKHFGDNGSRFMSIADMLDGGVTGIEELKDGKIEEWKSESWYDLNGRRVLSPSKGVYIHNGKQMIVK